MTRWKPFFSRYRALRLPSGAQETAKRAILSATWPVFAPEKHANLPTGHAMALPHRLQLMAKNPNLLCGAKFSRRAWRLWASLCWGICLETNVTAARYLGISPRTIRRWVESGALRALRVFGRCRLRSQWLDEVYMQGERLSASLVRRQCLPGKSLSAAKNWRRDETGRIHFLV